jgi:hypothetical protein
MITQTTPPATCAGCPMFTPYPANPYSNKLSQVNPGWCQWFDCKAHGHHFSRTGCPSKGCAL